VPPFPFNGVFWQRQIHALNDAGYNSLAVNLPGIRREPYLTPHFTIDSHVKFLSTLIPPSAKIFLVGNSLGGYVVQRYVAAMPENVLGMVLAHTKCRSDSPEEGEKRAQFLAKVQEIQRVEPFAKESVMRMLGSESRNEGLRELLISEYQDQDLYGFCGNLLALAYRPDSSEFLKSLRNKHPLIAKNTTLIASDDDDFAPLSVMKEMAQFIGDGNLEVLHGVGHLSPVTNTESFNKILLTALNKVTETTPF
jgi:pimeloyl-ACP methyl ester carboxylesterase